MPQILQKHRPYLYGAAGSDLAGIRTRAVRDGDDWIINGQKIWTSGAHYSDFGILITRSDPTVAKHKGLTFFYLDMKSPGVEIKPIKQISGTANFNEVYFTNVRIPDSQRLGEPGQHWQVSLTTLMNERAAIGGADAGMGIRELIELARAIEPPGGAISAGQSGRSSGVEHNLAKVGVVSSHLIARSRYLFIRIKYCEATPPVIQAGEQKRKRTVSPFRG